VNGYLDLLRVIEQQGVIENVAPIQLGISLAHPGRLANAGIRGGVSPGWAVRSAVAGVLLKKRRPAPGRSQRNRPGDRRRGGAAKRIAACYIRTHLEGSTRRSQLARSTDQTRRRDPRLASRSQRTLVLLCRANRDQLVSIGAQKQKPLAKNAVAAPMALFDPARKRGSLDFCRARLPRRAALRE